MTEKKTRKKVSPPPLTLKRVQPSTDNQRIAFEAFGEGQHLMLSGMAGTGKTYISLYMALSAVQEREYDRVIIVRSIVPTRDPGFLPGSLKEKTRVYEDPYYSVCADLYESERAYEQLRGREIIDFKTTSYLRGTTMSDCVVVVDEIQNMKYHEIDSVITRIGKNCRLIVLGDYRQSDLVRDQEKQGILDFIRVANHMRSFTHVEFGHQDILRSDLVKEYLIARDELRIS